MDGYDFQIRIGAQRVVGRLSTDDSAFRECGEGPVEKDPHLETLTVLEQWLKRWHLLASLETTQAVRLLVPDTFKVLGTHLWKLALDNPVGDVILDRYKDARRQGKKVRVRLSFEDDAGKLADLPWEFVRSPDRPGLRSFYLASELKLVLGRYVDGVEDLPLASLNKNVSVLLVLSLPHLDEFADERAKFEQLASWMERSETTSCLEVEVISDWNTLDVAHKLEELAKAGRKVDVVHLMSLSSLEEGNPHISLPTVDENGEPRWLDSQSVVEALAGDYAPTVVVLHLSDRRGGDCPEHFERMAPALVRERIPAVLAMQYPMSSDQGDKFLTSFYEALLRGERIGEAVQEGRRTMRLEEFNRHFGTPVLYMQSASDGGLVKVNGMIASSDSDPVDRRDTLGTSRARTSRSRHRATSDLTKRLVTKLRDSDLSADDREATRRWIEEANWSSTRVARNAIAQWRRNHQGDPDYESTARALLKAIDDPTRGEAST